ncbi:MAG: hypothetical protein GF368_04340 [Candidatus Aenigmarchaeota archaeon]|nr:hypothetical protein [Candidatus Aenigmarchaeota archaeon]
MPSWKVHLIFDMIILIVILGTLYGWGLITDYILIIFLTLFNLLATISPDIDTPKSNIRKYLSLLLSVIITVYLIINFSLGSIFYGLLGFIIVYLVIRFFPTKHRGATHKLWFSLVFSLGMTSILWFMFNFSGFEFGIYFLIIFWGYLSHLILDKVGF